MRGTATHLQALTQVSAKCLDVVRVQQDLEIWPGLVRIRRRPQACHVGEIHYLGEAHHVLCSPKLSAADFVKQRQRKNDERTARRWRRISQDLGAHEVVFERNAVDTLIVLKVVVAQAAHTLTEIGDIPCYLAAVEQTLTLDRKRLEQVCQRRHLQHFTRLAHPAGHPGTFEHCPA